MLFGRIVVSDCVNQSSWPLRYLLRDMFCVIDFAFARNHLNLFLKQTRCETNIRCQGVDAKRLLTLDRSPCETSSLLSLTITSIIILVITKYYPQEIVF